MTSTRWARTSVVGNLKEKLAALENEVTLEAGGCRWVLYRGGASEYLEAMLASYRSILDRADTWRLRRALRSRSPWLERLSPPPFPEALLALAEVFSMFRGPGS